MSFAGNCLCHCLRTKEPAEMFWHSLPSITCSCYDGVSVFINQYAEHTFWHSCATSCLKELVAFTESLLRTQTFQELAADSDSDNGAILENQRNSNRLTHVLLQRLAYKSQENSGIHGDAQPDGGGWREIRPNSIDIWLTFFWINLCRLCDWVGGVFLTGRQKRKRSARWPRKKKRERDTQRWGSKVCEGRVRRDKINTIREIQQNQADARSASERSQRGSGVMRRADMRFYGEVLPRKSRAERISIMRTVSGAGMTGAVTERLHYICPAEDAI